MGYPVSTAKDIIENPQLQQERLAEKIEHSKLGSTITYPGPWAKFRNPLLGLNAELL